MLQIASRYDTTFVTRPLEHGPRQLRVSRWEEPTVKESQLLSEMAVTGDGSPLISTFATSVATWFIGSALRRVIQANDLSLDGTLCRARRSES